jgi:hypothetical protein
MLHVTELLHEGSIIQEEDSLCYETYTFMKLEVTGSTPAFTMEHSPS